MKVIDAGTVVELLVGGLDPAVLGGEPIVVPHLLDSEVTHVLRRLVQQGHLSEEDGWIALESFIALSLRRSSVAGLRRRMWELKDNASAYDATYVALAESLGLALVTTDARLARAPGVRCRVEVV